MRTLGIEREFFITQNGQIVPLIGVLLPHIHANLNSDMSKKQFGFELFAGQIEDRTKGLTTINALLDSLEKNEKFMKLISRKLGLDLLCRDYVIEKELGILKVNPFDKRHQNIWKTLPHSRKVAASQVAATHIHVSVTGEEAVKVLNFCRRDLIDKLAALGDFSHGKRLKAYRVMAKVYGDPPVFKDMQEMMNYIQKKGGERDVWDMVRYKLSTGTVEFRMFGATNSPTKIKKIVQACISVVEKAC